MRYIGCREDSGSWKIIAILPAADRAQLLVVALSRSIPSNVMEPLMLRGGRPREAHHGERAHGLARAGLADDAQRLPASTE
jgi:hypothetical protein